MTIKHHIHPIIIFFTVIIYFSFSSCHDENEKWFDNERTPLEFKYRYHQCPTDISDACLHRDLRTLYVENYGKYTVMKMLLPFYHTIDTLTCEAFKSSKTAVINLTFSLKKEKLSKDCEYNIYSFSLDIPDITENEEIDKVAFFVSLPQLGYKSPIYLYEFSPDMSRDVITGVNPAFDWRFSIHPLGELIWEEREKNWGR